MQAITKSHLRKEINAILADANLSEISAKKVRQILESKFKLELITFRTEINDMIMEYVNSNVKSDHSDDESSSDDDKKDKKDDDDGEDDEKSEEVDTKKKAVKRPSSTSKRAKKSRDSSNESESESDDDRADEDYNKSAKKAKVEKKKAKNDSESDSDGNGKKSKKAAPAAKKPAAKGKGNGFTRAYTLSPELAKLMGSESMARHEVVKKVWQIIKERNLFDPKNKQYAICDSDLSTVIGVKRFRTFGMLKYLRNHFLN